MLKGLGSAIQHLTARFFSEGLVGLPGEWLAFIPNKAIMRPENSLNTARAGKVRRWPGSLLQLHQISWFLRRETLRLVWDTVEVKNSIGLFYSHRTFAKVVCIGILFSPLWGFLWFSPNFQEVWVLSVLRNYISLAGLRISSAYLSVCILAFASCVIVTFIRDSIVRVPLMVIILIGWGFELIILDLNGSLSNQDLFWVLWQERALASEAVEGYGGTIIRDCGIVVILATVLCASPAQQFSVPRRFGLMPILSAALVTGVILHTQGATQTFPIPFGTFANAAIVLAHAWNSSSDLPASRDIVISELPFRSFTQPFNTIVMIMDESVRGDYLSLNDANRNTTPFLKNADHLINFGVASSGGNCSIISRTIFRFGMRQSDLPNRWGEALNRPNFWEFAHRAGYKTVHLDAWYGSMSIGNGYSLAEKASIDSNISIIKNPIYLRDKMLADKLIETLTDEKPAFIFVEKFGVHVPYSDKYPQDFHAVSTPLETHTGLSVDELEIARYPNAIAWSVDEFFRRLLPAVNLSKTLIIYTSDHGDNLIPGHNPHCSTLRMIPLGEEKVPLFAITQVPDWEQRLAKGAARGFDRFSHFEVFPTLLLAMGYDADWVKRSYGPSLMDAPAPDRKFMIGSPDFQPRMIPVDRNFGPTTSSTGSQPAQVPGADVN
jgi:glucan phosphoethanolaminetransferase (alkaline phosphatase superfamily)